MQKNFITVLAIFIGSTCYPQQTYLKLNLQESYIKLSGTSTFGNWKSKAKSFSGYFTYVGDKDLSSPKKGSASIKIKSDSIISRNRLRDKSTHKALKSKEFPFITFTSNNGKLYKKIAENKIQLIITGILNIAGKSKKISLLVNLTKLSNNSILFKGYYKLKMTDYGVRPPSAFFGLIKVKDEILIDYRFVFST